MEPGLWLVLDAQLAVLIVALGWAAVSARALRRGVVLFIAFGLLLAIIWARLRAPDLALAEAAIGAGLSGALLLSALGDAGAVERDRPPRRMVWAVNLITSVLAVIVGAALLEAMAGSDRVRLADEVARQMPDSGVTNPVTAVLLNFRAYDTLLELAVLLAAVLGIQALGPARPAVRPAGPLLAALVRWLVPVLVVTGGYLLWIGAKAPGGAFQAGAVLAAAGVLLRLSGRASGGLPGERAGRWLLVGGIGVFTAVGLAVTVTGRAFLEYPENLAGALILLIEVAATLAIAVTLVLAYLAGRPRSEGA
jgi:multisubunit Na+/H+ antiporter MnhB subunit